MVRNLLEVPQWGADKQNWQARDLVQENLCDPGAGQGRDTDILSCGPAELAGWQRDPGSKFQ